MDTFKAYEIKEVCEFTDPDGGTSCQATHGIEGDASKREGYLGTFWTLYGRKPDQFNVLLSEAIADRQTYQQIRELYFSIGGVDCGPDPQDWADLPIRL